MTIMELMKMTYCNDGVEYFRTKPNLYEAWNDCKRGDWMLDFARKLGVENRKLFLAKARCAQTAFHLIEHSKVLKKGVEIAEKYGTDQCDKEDLIFAINNVQKKVSKMTLLPADIVYSALSDDYWLAGYTAVCTSINIKNAAILNGFSVHDAEDMKTENLLKTADICREILTDEVFKKIRKA